MANILTYIKNYGNLSFDELEFNELDNLIFSQLVYINFSNIVPNKISKTEFILIKDAANKYYDLHQTLDMKIGLLIPDEVLPMLKELAKSKRFSNLKLHGYVQEIDKKETKQFSSLAIEIKENLYYKENCDLAYAIEHNLCICGHVNEPKNRNKFFEESYRLYDYLKMLPEVNW